jgi:outer membrane protein TolC
MKQVLIFLLLLWTGSTAAQHVPRFTLVQCYGLARAHYPLAKRYGLIEQTMANSVSGAGKALLPQLSAGAGATYQSDVTALPFDAAKIGALIPGFSIPTVSKDQYQVTAELTQPLWDGGNTRAAQSLFRAQAEAERKQTDSELYALNERVNRAYFGCLLQDALLQQNHLLRKELGVNIERVEAMIRNGTAGETDRETLEVELLNARQREAELQAGSKAWLAILSALTGQAIDQAAQLAIPPMPGDPLLFMEIRRPELDALQAQEQLIEAGRKQTDAALRPRIGLFVQGGYGRPGLNMLDNGFEPFYVAGLRLTWNIGRYYTLGNDRRKTEISLRSVNMQREIFLFNTSLQLVRQHAEIEKMDKLLDSDREIIRLRTNIRKAAEAKYAGGTIAAADLIREINAEDLARQNEHTHRIMRLMEVYALLFATNHAAGE